LAAEGSTREIKQNNSFLLSIASWIKLTAEEGRGQQPCVGHCRCGLGNVSSSWSVSTRFVCVVGCWCSLLVVWYLRFWYGSSDLDRFGSIVRFWVEIREISVWFEWFWIDLVPTVRNSLVLGDCRNSFWVFVGDFSRSSGTPKKYATTEQM
jgi:hypothetical protein